MEEEETKAPTPLLLLLLLQRGEACGVHVITRVAGGLSGDCAAAELYLENAGD